MSTIAKTSKIIKHSPICIIGSGSASLDVASILKRQGVVNPQDIRVFDRTRTHYYQSGFTMVGGGLINFSKTHEQRDQLFDKLISQTYSHVAKVDPENNMLVTEEDEYYTYDQLVVAAGNILRYDITKGATEALDDPNCPVTSIYSYKYAQKVIDVAKQVESGEAIFNVAPMPIKCGGAPHKIAFLLDDLWKKNKVREDIKINQYIAGGAVFGQAKYAEAISKQYKKKDIPFHLFKNIVEIKGKDKIVVIQDMKTQELIQKQFDFLHFVPTQQAPAFIKEAGLADANGYTDVDPGTLQHKKYKNVWGLGDSCNSPTSKTFSAITAQAPVVVKNLVSALKKDDISRNQKYDGYTCCPLLIGQNKLILAEFKYDGVADETFYSAQERPNILFYWLKLHFFPWVYFNLVKRGIWFGRKGVRLHKL